jgi:hypothetical protein
MRFGISETSWMLPKILRMRLEAIDRFSLARAVLIAMEMCLAFSRHPGEKPGPVCRWLRAPERGRSPMRRARKDAKSRESRVMEPQLQRLAKPLPINALNALRDGASCSDAMGCGR